MSRIKIEVQAEMVIDDDGLQVVLDHNKGRTILIASGGHFQFKDQQSLGALGDVIRDSLELHP